MSKNLVSILNGQRTSLAEMILCHDSSECVTHSFKSLKVLTREAFKLRRSASHKLNLYHAVKRQGFGVRDRWSVVNNSSWSNYHCCSLIGGVNGHERADDADF